jgi:hypothetical protein
MSKRVLLDRDGLKVEAETISLSIDSIKPYKNNPRINRDAIPIAKQSIIDNGYITLIEVDENNEILSGHTRHSALKELNKQGFDFNEVTVHKLTGFSEAQKKKYRIMANKSAEAASYNFELLKGELSAIQELTGDDTEILSEATGYSITEMERLLERNAKELEIISDIAEDEFGDYTQDIIDNNKASQGNFTPQVEFQGESEKKRYPMTFWFDTEEDYKIVKAALGVENNFGSKPDWTNLLLQLVKGE